MKFASYCFVAFLFIAAASTVRGQEGLPVRPGISPEEIITITGDTPFNKAMTIFGNAFKRFAQKPLVYEESVGKGGGEVCVLP